MNKILLGVSLLGIAFATGCGSGSGGNDGGGPFTNCTTDSECQSTEVCNTLGHVCLTKCSTAADCTNSSEPNCAAVPGGTQLACQCTSSASTSSCGGGTAYCNTTDGLCEVQCSDSSGCSDFNPARTCVSSECVGSVVDAGSDCTVSGCPATETCNTTSKLCEASCGAPNTKGNCGADQYCDGTSCQTPTACAAASSPPGTTANSPIVWGVTATGTTMDTTCVDSSGNPLPITTFQGYYLNEGTGVRATGTSSNGSGVYKDVGYLKSSSSNIYATYLAVTISSDTFTFQICGYSSGSSLHAAVVLVDGTGNTLNTAGTQIVASGDVSLAACLP